jgi:hypothetical protein
MKMKAGVKVKLFPCVIKHHAMKALGKAEIKLHVFLNFGTKWRYQLHSSTVEKWSYSSIYC